MEQKEMKPIWYFVGLMLLIMGALVLFSGIYHLFIPPAKATVLAELHPAIWWGGVMVIGGGMLYVTARKQSA